MVGNSFPVLIKGIINMIKSKEFEIKTSFPIGLNKRFQIGKAQMKAITKSILWDIFRNNRKTDNTVFITDSNGKHYCFSILLARGFSWFDICVSCSYTDYELAEFGYMAESDCNDREYSNSLFIDYETKQHRALNFRECEYEFNRG